MTTLLEDLKSVSISEGIKGVRIYCVLNNGQEMEFVTDGNKFIQKLK